MSGFVEGVDRSQSTFFPPMLDDYVAEDNPVRAARPLRISARTAAIAFYEVCRAFVA